MTMKEYKFKINGKDFQVCIGETDADGQFEVNVNGKTYLVETDGLNVPARAQGAANGNGGAGTSGTGAANGNAGTSSTGAANGNGTGTANVNGNTTSTGSTTGAGEKVTSPLPGVIIEISVKEGQSVKAGDKVAVIEAMKMENDITATTAGTITAIHVNKGDSVLEGADIVTIA